MRTLFAISIIALIALLWAAVSTARHVRQARRRNNQGTHLPPQPAQDTEFEDSAIESSDVVTQVLATTAAAPPDGALAGSSESSAKRKPEEPAARRPLAVSPPAPSGRRKLGRPDWAYFNKDMGDLTDPAPRSAKERDRPSS